MNLPVYSKKVEVACGGGVWAAVYVKAGVQFRLTPQIIPRGHRGVCLRVIGWDNVSVCGEPV